MDIDTSVPLQAVESDALEGRKQKRPPCESRFVGIGASWCTAADRTAPLSPAGDGKTVVIVEDDADNREMLEKLLELHGYQVHSAGTGREGVELIERLRPLAALVDIGLPGMNGYEVAEHVRRNLVDDHTYLVALTGYGQRADVEQALERGFDRHIVKPLNIDKLIEVLAQRPA
jgi:CheY-like chemotaxis protein